MAEQEKSLAIWKPTKFMTNLDENTGETMARMSRYTPAMIELQIEQYPKLADKVDSLDRSLRYFYEYEGKNKAQHILTLKKELENAEYQLSRLTYIRSIRTLSIENRQETLYHIGIMIAQLLKFFMVDKAIKTEAVKIASRMIVDEFPSLSLEEICICFNQAMKGHYGEDFNRLDGPTVMKWLRIYQKDKNDRLSNQQYARSAQHKAGNNRDRYDHAVDNQTKLREAILWRFRK